MSPFTGFTWTNDLARYDTDTMKAEVEHGMVWPQMEMPYPPSPPKVSVAGATDTSQDTMKVMAYHGIVYSHSG